MTCIPEMTRLPQRDKLEYSKPALLPDSEIYLAFRPWAVENTGALFGRLDISRDEMTREIEPCGDNKFILRYEIVERWRRLEQNLLDACKTLLCSPTLPTITYPKSPREYGYGDPHTGKEFTIQCAFRSRDAFANLASLLSFSIALHMREDGSLGAAFDKLTNRRVNPVNRSWIDILAPSYVCNFKKNIRVGGTFNPYQSHWVRHLRKLALANVPLWILWGHDYHTLRPLDSSAADFLPPPDVIEDAKRREMFSNSAILPTMRYDPGFGDLSASGVGDFDDPMGGQYDIPHYSDSGPPAASSSTHTNLSASSSTSIQPSTSSVEAEGKRALAELEAFFDKVQRDRAHFLATEPEFAKQQRLAREKHASTHKYSKKSVVFIWMDEGDGSYVREKLNSKQVEDEWSNFTRNQRRYTGHRNEWDLCPQLPRFSDENPGTEEPYDSDEDSDHSYILPVAGKKVARQVRSSPEPALATAATNALKALAPVAGPSTMVEVSETDRLPASRVETIDFVSFFKDRLGYDVYSPSNWHRNLHPRNADGQIAYKKALLALSVSRPSSGPGIEEAVLNFFNILANTTWSFRDLPDSFDHSPKHRTPVSLASDTLVVSLATGEDPKVYLIRKRGPVSDSPWMIATSDPSTVLLIFRKKWSTLAVIARELVQRGAPFNTVAALESAAPVLSTPLTATGLKIRPKDWAPTKEDYLEYLRAREDLLKGPKGRAALLHGGIIARIARDVLDPSIVLGGPSSREHVVGYYDRFILVDDVLNEQDLAVISGVYHVQNQSQHTTGDETMKILSWWPQNSTWTSKHPFMKTEWTQAAEDFYQKHLHDIENGKGFTLMNVGLWKQCLRKAKASTVKVEHGVAHYQGGYVDHWLQTHNVSALSCLFWSVNLTYCF